MSLPLYNLPSFSPINAVTPFTYRDNATYLTILHALQDKVNDLITTLNTLNLSVTADMNIGFAQMVAELNASLNTLRDELILLVAGSHDESVATDPTNGQRFQGLSTVVSHVYDNVRVFAYFAMQYDEMEQTALAYDTLELSARHFDLGITYPTLNDVLEA
jgi:hypothetical protein